MEQALGHVTHYRNVRDLVDGGPGIDPVWLPIPFDVRGPARLVPGFRSNWSVRASWRTRRALDATRTRTALDAVVFHTQVTSLFSVGIMHQLPAVISLDATPINYDTIGLPYGHQPAGRGILDRKKYELNRRAFHAAATLVTWSDWARRSLITDYGVDSERIRVLAPGAARAYFDIGRIRVTQPIDDPTSRRVRILFVGGDFNRKGGPALLAAMRGPLGERCHLEIATQSEVPCQPNVTVHRGLKANSSALLQLFAKADIFVLPTQADALALVLMEAAAAALPVVTTNVGGLSEAVRADESGFVVPPGDQAALEGALGALAEDPDRRRRMSLTGFTFARQKFDARRNNRCLLDLVGELVEARRVAREAA
jgi:glycosyltransferase involved in cell wall biosynthesis